MKLSIILSTKNTETNWNAFRLANIALIRGDKVSIFLLGEAIEYDRAIQEPFNLKEQVDTFLKEKKAKIIACGTCMELRHQKESATCPMGGMEDLYSLVAKSDKILTF